MFRSHRMDHPWVYKTRRLVDFMTKSGQRPIRINHRPRRDERIDAGMSRPGVSGELAQPMSIRALIARLIGLIRCCKRRAFNELADAQHETLDQRQCIGCFAYPGAHRKSSGVDVPVQQLLLLSLSGLPAMLQLRAIHQGTSYLTGNWPHPPGPRGTRVFTTGKPQERVSDRAEKWKC
jgi:hypothetical protein